MKNLEKKCVCGGEGGEWGMGDGACGGGIFSLKQKNSSSQKVKQVNLSCTQNQEGREGDALQPWDDNQVVFDRDGQGVILIPRAKGKQTKKCTGGSTKSGCFARLREKKRSNIFFSFTKAE